MQRSMPIARLVPNCVAARRSDVATKKAGARRVRLDANVQQPNDQGSILGARLSEPHRPN
jgi:hypothetical protein